MALDLLTRDAEEQVWIKASDLREKVRDLLGYSEDRMGAALWIEHILKRLQLTDRNCRKTDSGGQMYLMERAKILDMMERYEVECVEN
ncbi:MAG: hypothetical protein L0154_16935 [Chloroflexi bacterium]|nr:hypothetical protein [Chloroflexota bacterium]